MVSGPKVQVKVQVLVLAPVLVRVVVPEKLIVFRTVRRKVTVLVKLVLVLNCCMWNRRSNGRRTRNRRNRSSRRGSTSRRRIVIVVIITWTSYYSLRHASWEQGRGSGL